MTQAAGFVYAQHDEQCQDTWQVEKVRPTALAAYKRLEKQGAIKIQYPVRVHKDRLVISYTAQIPHEWVLGKLKQCEQEVRGEMLREMQQLEQDLVSMADGLTQDTLPAYDAISARYGDVYKLLDASGIKFKVFA